MLFIIINNDLRMKKYNDFKIAYAPRNKMIISSSGSPGVIILVLE